MSTSPLCNPLLIDNTAVRGTFGMKIKSREFVAFDEYRMGFNGKENDREISGDGATYDYGFRIYDSRLGKFLSVDPLTKSFPMLTPYQYASNTPISSIDIDGLEAKLSIYGIGYGDESTFEQRANVLKSKSNGTTVHGIDSGKGLLSLLKEQTKQEGSIASFSIFSHGFSKGVILTNSAGFYKTGTDVPDNIGNAAFIDDIQAGMKSGDIKFEANAVALFAGCNLGSDYKNEDSFATDFTKKTGVTSIAAEGQVGPEIIDGKETGRSTAKQFYMFEKQTDGAITKTALGNVIDFSRYNAPMQTMPMKEIKQIETKTDVQPTVAPTTTDN